MSIKLGDKVRLCQTGVVLRFHETGMAVVKWENGITGMAQPNQLAHANDPDLEALKEYVHKACIEAGKRGRVSGEPLPEWISRLPMDIERYK